MCTRPEKGQPSPPMSWGVGWGGWGGEGESGERPSGWLAPQPQASIRAPLRRRGGPAPGAAHPRPRLAGPAVIQRQRVRTAAPSLFPPPSPRAWQEERATWSGNKGPRGPRRSGTRCLHHSSPGAPMRAGLDSPPTRARVLGDLGLGESRPGLTHTPGIGSDSGNRDPRVLLPEGRSIPAPWRLDPGPPSSSRPAPPCPSALRGCGYPPAAANATQQPWQRPERGAARRPPPVLRGRRRRLGVPPRPRVSGHRSAPPALSAAPEPSPSSDTGRALSLLREGGSSALYLVHP